MIRSSHSTRLIYRTIADIDVCTESESLEVKVPMIFLGTVGFSPPREGRYISSKLSSSLLPSCRGPFSKASSSISARFLCEVLASNLRPAGDLDLSGLNSLISAWIDQLRSKIHGVGSLRRALA
jgi:hypothetical protein